MISCGDSSEEYVSCERGRKLAVNYVTDLQISNLTTYRTSVFEL